MPLGVESVIRAAVLEQSPGASDIVVVDATALDDRPDPFVHDVRVAWKADGLSHLGQFVVKRELANPATSAIPLLNALALTSIPAPRVVYSVFAEPGSYIVMERLPGRPLRDALTAAGMRWELSALAFTFARQLARIHALDWRVVAPWMADAESLPEDIVDQQIVDIWSNWERRTADAPAGYQDLFNRALAWLDPRRPVDVSVCLCHSDFHPGNVLIENDEVSGVVDWGHALVTDAAYDLALLTFELRRLGLPDEDIELFAQAVLGAYLQSSPRSVGNVPFYTVARLLTATLDALDFDVFAVSNPSPSQPTLEEARAALERAVASDGRVPWRS